jgi:hypothetical protein
MANLSIKATRNMTALMQHMQRLMTTGHYYWTGDRIAMRHIPKLIDKYPDFALRADAPARAYRKRTGRASVHLVLHPVVSTNDMDIPWWMLSTGGKLGLASDISLPGKIHDARTLEGRLWSDDYELMQLEKNYIAGKPKTMTWTWRMTPARFREWQALLIERVKARDIKSVMAVFDLLREMPQFAGIRSQILRLHFDASRMLVKLGMPGLVPLDLPVMRMQKLWLEDFEV